MESFNSTASGIITGVGHGTMRDGPGWRSIVYFKGCNFKCRWCGSPDTMSAAPEIMFYPERVKYPGRLAAACRCGAINVRGTRISLQRDKCEECVTRDCVRACLDGSIELSGYTATVGAIVEEILQYKRAHENYGLTISGGEAPLQWNFYLELLKACKRHGLHTAVETNGSVRNFPESLPWLDLVICDLKTMDPQVHKRWTGLSNRNVLRNITAVSKSGKPLWIRIPIVPDVNDGENIDLSIEFIKDLPGEVSVELLGFHKLGLYKWEALGKKCKLEKTTPPAPEYIASIERRFTDAGIKVIRT